MNKPLCALTMGDPAGIGPEIILKALFSRRATEAADMVVIGYPEPFERDEVMLDLDIAVHRIHSPQNMSQKPDTVNLIMPDQKVSIPLEYGIIDSRCGAAAAHCIELAAKLALSGDIDA
ncbi:MAG: hypothetical protein ACYC9O_13760, partial [Candidatus Latescibacterota bacterium]